MSEIILTQPHIEWANYEEGELMFKLRQGARVWLPARSIPGLENATDEQLGELVVSATGNSIRWKSLHIKVGAPSLMRLASGLPAFNKKH